MAAPGLLPSEVSELVEGRDSAALAAASLRCEAAAASRRLAQYLEEGHSVRTVLDGNAVIAMGVPPRPAGGEGVAPVESSTDGPVGQFGE